AAGLQRVGHERARPQADGQGRIAVSEEQGKPRDEGALPGLKDKPVLGVPEARVKAKSNVSKLFVVLGMTAGVLFVVSGIALAVSAHMAKKKEAEPTATAAAGARAPVRNSAVNSASIEQTKAELKAKEQRDAAAAAAA